VAVAVGVVAVAETVGEVEGVTEGVGWDGLSGYCLPQDVIKIPVRIKADKSVGKGWFFIVHLVCFSSLASRRIIGLLVQRLVLNCV
jgi:hypothetical protein